MQAERSNQERLDEILGVTAQERAQLAEGKTPPATAKELKTIGSSTQWGMGAAGLVLLAFLLAWFGWFFPLDLGTEDGLVTLFTVGPIALILLGVGVSSWLRDLLHRRDVLRERTELRVLEGEVETKITWQAHGGSTAWLHLKDSEQAPVQLQPVSWVDTELRKLTIEGWARVFEITVPSLREGLSPGFQVVLAIEVADDTRLDPREPDDRD